MLPKQMDFTWFYQTSQRLLLLIIFFSSFFLILFSVHLYTKVFVNSQTLTLFRLCDSPCHRTYLQLKLLWLAAGSAAKWMRFLYPGFTVSRKQKLVTSMRENIWKGFWTWSKKWGLEIVLEGTKSWEFPLSFISLIYDNFWVLYFLFSPSTM